MSQAYAYGDPDWVEIDSLKGLVVDGVATSYQTFSSCWTDAERAAFGIYPITDDAIPDGKVPIGSSLAFADGVVTRSFALADAPSPPVPEVVTMRQARLALLQAGLLDDAEAAIASLPEATRRAAQIEWEYATELRRDHALLAAIGASLSLNSADIDGLFAAAAAI